MAKNLYDAWAINERGASLDINAEYNNYNKFTSARTAESVARARLGAGWTVKIAKLSTDENGYVLDSNVIKEFTIR